MEGNDFVGNGRLITVVGQYSAKGGGALMAWGINRVQGIVIVVVLEIIHETVNFYEIGMEQLRFLISFDNN